jgi:hypothetical protein
MPIKYTNEVIIQAPRARVVELFEDPNNVPKWQPGFQSMEVISGEAGEVGSKTKLRYKMGKREIEMIETITEKNLPELFAGTYEAKGVWNEVKNHFEDLGNGSTRYWTENEFKMSGMMKLFALLMPGAFKKQSQKYLDLFRDFVEGEH